MLIPLPGTDKVLGKGVFFIAEIGKNFIETPDDRPVSEYLDNAMKLVDAAIDAGADAVKFQTHVVDDEVLDIEFTSPHFVAKDRYSWVSRNMRATPVEEFWKPLKAHCDARGTVFFSTPMSRLAAMKLENIGVPLWKVGSGDVQDFVLMNHLMRSHKPIIISTGMVSRAELDEVVKYIEQSGSPLSILYCISEYPCPPEKFNLTTMSRFIEAYPNAVVGFSDHSLTHDASFAAIKLGAKIIEKHFSFSRDRWGADHKVSLTPGEFAGMVSGARTGTYMQVDERAFLGTLDMELEGATNRFRPFFNKALMAGQDIDEGGVLDEEMIYAMRPVSLAGGMPSHLLPQILGKRLRRPLRRFDPIVPTDLV